MPPRAVRPGDIIHARVEFRRRRRGQEFEIGGVAVQRVSGNVEADEFVLVFQALGRFPLRHDRRFGFGLAFAAGAMIYVVIEEVVPETQESGNADAATMGAVCGFIVMMTLDVALG